VFNRLWLPRGARREHAAEKEAEQRVGGGRATVTALANMAAVIMAARVVAVRAQLVAIRYVNCRRAGNRHCISGDGSGHERQADEGAADDRTVL
jgi:hypothetical protein